MSDFSPLSLLTRRTVEKAVADDRRRIARDLHDGLAQELAFISLESHRLAERGERSAADLAQAADRALREVRCAIEELAQPTGRPLHEAIAETAAELTARSNATLQLDVDPRVELAPEPRESLLRILREAVCNGLRHGGASTIEVKLSSDSGLRMSVADNGVGFDPGAPQRQGSFGLTSMTERAQALGGKLRLRSHPGGGTSVEVLLPGT
jgi:signal transduction histidine kinase